MPYLPKSSLVPFPDVSSILHASQQVKWFWQNNILFAALGGCMIVPGQADLNSVRDVVT